MRFAGCMLSSIALAWLSSVGCDRLEQRKESLLSEPVEDAELQRTIRGGLPSVAVDAIAQARCTREQRCENIGAGREYPTAVDCEARVRAEWEEDLNSVACPRGVNEAALTECLRELRDTSCAGLGDALGRWAKCAASDMCDNPRKLESSPP